MNYLVSFVFLHISTALIIALLFFTLRIKSKSQIHLIFVINTILILIWSIGNLLEIYTRLVTGNTIMFFVYFYLIGLSYIPVSILYTGIVFANTKIDFSNKKHILILLFPFIDSLIIITNEFHHLFLIKYSPSNLEIEYGIFMYVHSIISYVYILIGLYYLLFYSIKNSSFFSKQSLLIFIGSLPPFLVNILYTLKIFDLQASSTPIAFSFTVLCYALAIIKFDFLNIVPIALQKVVDNISDSFIVINENYDIIDYNKALITTFNNMLVIPRNTNLINFIDTLVSVNITKEELVKYIQQSINDNISISFNKSIKINELIKHFTIEITPIFNNRKYIGSIILLKDITLHINNLERIKENQAILIEQERLASLGQLIGGIAHNLKTPIMSISGGIEAVKDLVYEYRDSIDNRSVTEQDHKEIANEMINWLNKMKPYCSYMSDVINAVKGQAVRMNDSTSDKFTVDELMKRVDLLMKHELKFNHCAMNIDSLIDMKTEIKGEVNNLVQVFDNIIINAVHAYEGKEGIIDLKIIRSGDNIEFVFRDYAKGISDVIKDRLLKEMVTTKGKKGTGLGLYMSYSTIKGRFSGNMTFTSKEGLGTTFIITIPCISPGLKEDGE